VDLLRRLNPNVWVFTMLCVNSVPRLCYLERGDGEMLPRVFEDQLINRLAVKDPNLKAVLMAVTEG